MGNFRKKAGAIFVVVDVGSGRLINVTVTLRIPSELVNIIQLQEVQ
jgi:hypothetical protein